MLSTLKRVWWGSHPQVLLKIYQAIVRGSVEYAAIIFSLKNSSYFAALKKIQNRALRFRLGMRISTLINILHAESCEPPFLFRFNYLATRYVLSNLAFTNHPV